MFDEYPEFNKTPEQTQNQTQSSFFDEDITFRWEAFENNPDGLVDYGMCIPSSANEYEEIPLIVWLHGWFPASESNNLDVDAISTKTTGIPYAVLGGSNLEKFNAYILCPKFPGKDVKEWWEPNQIKKLVDKIIKEYNVDKDNVVIIGHSFGGGNVPKVVNGMPGYFSKAVICSGYDSTLLSIPTQCYVGTNDSESGIQWGYSIENKIKATNDKNTILCRIVSSHGTPIKAYKIDSGKFGRYSK